MPRRTRLKSNADTQKAWEKRTRANQLARHRERGWQTSKFKGRGGRVVLPPEPVVVDPLVVEAVERATARPVRYRSPSSRWSDTASARAFRKAVRERSRGLCEANWAGVCPDGPHQGNQSHHRWLRSQGGPDHVDNGLYVCARVHQHAHDVDRAGAELRGIILNPFIAAREGVTPPGRSLPA